LDSRAPRLARRLATADLVLPAFTDEELAAIRPGGTVLGAGPAVDDLDPAAREAVLAASRRSLAAQRYLRRRADGRWAPAGPLRLVDEFRSMPTVVVVARRIAPVRTPDVRAHCVYGISGVAALDEWLDVDLPGVHRFVLRSAGRTGTALAAWLMVATRSAITIGRPGAAGGADVERLTLSSDGSSAVIAACDGAGRERHALDEAGVAVLVAAVLGAVRPQPTSVANRSS
jgi:hypothetical protein